MATSCTIVVFQGTDTVAFIVFFFTSLGLPLENGKANGLSDIGNSSFGLANGASSTSAKSCAIFWEVRQTLFLSKSNGCWRCFRET